MVSELGWAWFGAFLLMLLMLVHPFAALLTVLAVVCVVMCLFAELYVFGLRLNGVSSINLIMAVGLSIDYVVSSNCVATA
jgi:multidrug efflux pump subunit AcrB